MNSPRTVRLAAPTATALRLATFGALLLGAALMHTGVHAQAAKEQVLKESQVTEKAMIDLLKPSAPEAAASGAEPEAVSRSIRIGMRPAAAAAGSVGAGAAAQQSKRAGILVTFVTDSAELSGRARNALDVLAGAMKSNQLATLRFTIEGHADPRGSDERNLKLSQARAESVRQYLVEKHGLASERVSAVGKGSSALMNPADPAAPENRRVTIVSQQGG
jgi:outer membrane protein OmpA-like peptidoglycan-associated protein